MSMFKKAERRQAKLKIALAGPSGSGKTMSALRLAKAFGKKVAVIDTENGSASLYSDMPENHPLYGMEFDTLELAPPFLSAKYVQAIEAAELEKYDVIILDSFSHAWAGEGGTLDQKNQRDSRGGNQFANWREPKADYAKLKNAVLHSSAHIICTIRSKTAYVQGAGEGGRNTVQKLGMDPIAEPGIEYEFTVFFELAADNTAIASKDRTSMFKGQCFQITEKTGEKLMQWLSSAKPELPHEKKPEQKPSTPPSNGTWKPSDAQLKRLFAISRAHEWADNQVKSFLTDVYKLESTSDLSRTQYDEFCSTMENESYEAAMARLLDQEASAAG